jgi:enoyl-CoA hydratase
MADSTAISDFSCDAISIERQGHVGTLWLDRPQKRNAMNPELWNGIPAGIAALEADGATRAIVLAAKGKSFCVGLDLAMLQGGGSSDSKAGGYSFAGPPSGATANLRQLKQTQEIQASITSIAQASVPVSRRCMASA